MAFDFPFRWPFSKRPPVIDPKARVSQMAGHKITGTPHVSTMNPPPPNPPPAQFTPAKPAPRGRGGGPSGGGGGGSEIPELEEGHGDVGNETARDATAVDPEIVYLCNCYLSDGQKSSEINYYPKTSLSQHGERPAATAVMATDGTVTWEGQPVVGTFPDGNHFTSNITDHNGPVGAVKGSGFNDYHQFTCRQDSGRLLYSDANKSCYSIYYCQ